LSDFPVFVGKSPVDILRQEQELVRLAAAAFINTVGHKKNFREDIGGVQYTSGTGSLRL